MSAALGMGIDQSLTSTGVVQFVDARLGDMHGIKTSNNAPLITRQQYIVDEISKLAKKLRVRYAAMEDYAYHHFKRQPRTAAFLCELGGQIKSRLVLDGLTVFVVNPTYVKQWVGLKSRAEKGEDIKAEVIKAVNKQYGTKFVKKDNDIADALILAHIADACWMRMHGIPYPQGYVNSVQRGTVEAILGNPDNVLNGPLLG